MIELREITRDNYRECCNLKLDPQQVRMVAPNAFSLAQSKYEPEYIPLAIYHGDQMVGFLMYCLDTGVDSYWIVRLMIDRDHQRRGYAHAAMTAILRVLTADKNRSHVYIDTRPDNVAALTLYEKLGFRLTDEFEGEEVFLRLDY